MEQLQTRLVDEYREIHRRGHYGSAGIAHRDSIALAIVERGARSMLDYGCGQGRLTNMLADCHLLQTHRYDPAVAGIDRLDVDRVDLLVSTDVLEHVPDEEIDPLLLQMRRLATDVYWSICTRPAKKLLPSGANAHCSVHPAEWWQRRISVLFPEATIVFEESGEFCVIVSWIPRDRELYVRLERSAMLRKRIEKVFLLRVLRKKQRLTL